ncbi:CLUMA_CG014855, isoform A [Clunio marinus]|uniref:CLUMA_CG014855, isoform A n=1 Tax=Clunio marinus TaxID=568069 RepID=A0A1J1IN17_9DIPT|nr:CLUMA_CG014855, isoform A [Clunio marinus]
MVMEINETMSSSWPIVKKLDEKNYSRLVEDAGMLHRVRNDHQKSHLKNDSINENTATKQLNSKSSLNLNADYKLQCHA